MAKIASYPVLDFSGGVRRDKSFFDFNKNELAFAQNVEIDERGKIRSRRGSYQFGNTLTSGSNIENSFFFQRSAATPVTQFFCNTNDSTITLYRLLGGRLNTALTTTSTTVELTAAITGLTTAPSTIEIEGDLIAYTGGEGTSTLTGVTAITRAHAAGAAVHQWIAVTQDGTALDGQRGLYYAVLNNTLIMQGRNANWKSINNDDGITNTTVSSPPAGLFLTNYRDRLYCAGEVNPQHRTYFSNRGVPGTWTTGTDFFDAEDQRGEPIMGYKVLNDRLGIFKPNSIFTYDEIELKQRLTGVGAYNHKVIQEINGIVYTFCPNGIFATNLTEAKQIGNPVRQYWKNFQPVYDTVTSTAYGRVITNTFSAKFEKYYLLYIHDITDPETANDVVLVYDTEKKTWVTFTGPFTNFFHMNGFENFKFGDRINQFRPALFGGKDSTGGNQMVRFFENTFVDTAGTKRGSDIFGDFLYTTDIPQPIPIRVETPLYDLTHPELFKRFRQIRFYVERGFWNVEWRVQDDTGISPYKPLGAIAYPGKVLSFPAEAQGYRLGFRLSASNTDSLSILNGFVIEETEVVARK